MRVFHGIDHLPAFHRPAATVGSFDGVHGGHDELLSAVCRFARERGGESIVVTFAPHPRIVLEKQTDLRLLTTLDEKAYLLERAGIDNLVVIPFTREFSRTSSVDFIQRDLVGKLGIETLVMGYNHHFGHNKEGDYGSLHASERPELQLCRIDPFDVGGKKVGTHSGAVRYTIGQRKGLGLAMGAPVYVCAKDMQANTVTVGPESELFDTIVYANEVNWIAIPELEGPLRVTARTRYHQTEQPATVYPAGPDSFRLEFDQPQRAPTPGQAVVLYQGDVVLGGGTITQVAKG